MLLVRTVGIVTYPVSVAEAKSMAVDVPASDDALIQSFIEAATEKVGAMAGRVLASETWELSLETGIAGDVKLPKSPVQSVASITYFDADDVEQAADVADFYLFRDDDIAVLRPKSGVSWPNANALRSDAITIEFVAGYTDCPEILVHAVKLLVAYWYDNRNAASQTVLQEIPFGVHACVDGHRIGWVGA